MNHKATEAATFPERLKNLTSRSHQNLEDLPVSRSIVDPAVTKQQYVHYLQLMHDVVKDAEENIYPNLEGIIDDVADRHKAYMIENDLQSIGMNKNQTHKPLSAIGIITPAFALGIMYVMEGSTLGGRFILKNINEALGYTGETGAQYFAGYGNATGSRWKNFISQMAHYEEDNNNGEEIIAGANYAFDTINKYFSENTLQ